MVKDFYIGQSFLSRVLKDYWFEYCVFYGANRINATTWQVNFSMERMEQVGINTNKSTPFSLNIEVGTSLRFSGFSIFIEKNGSMSLRSNQFGDLYKGQRTVASVKFVNIGQDFIILEYEFAK